MALFLAAYLITWIFGVPAAENEVLRHVLSEHAVFLKNQRQSQEFPPSAHIRVALPVAPFLVIVKHDHVFAPLYGAGSTDLFLWFPWRIQQIGQFKAWVA